MVQSSSLINKNVVTENTHTYLFTSMVSHRGTPISFAMREDGQIFYSVLDMSNTEQNATKEDKNNDKNYWSKVDFDLAASRLDFPTEIMQVGYGLTPNFSIDKYNDKNKKISKGDNESEGVFRARINHFYSSTARLGAKEPFQALSDSKYIYIFRQSIAGNDPNNETPAIVNNTLLVDRFILSGTTLKLSREIRYQRSRHKTEPESRKDTLSAVDVEGHPFYEPTRELVFANNLSNGNFSVLLLPGSDSEEQRWQIFTADDKTGKVNSFNIRFDYSIVFDLSDSQAIVNEFIEKYELDGSLMPAVQAEVDRNTDLTINVDFNISATNLLILDSSDMAVGDLMLIDQELLGITEIRANHVVVTRGQLSTTSASHSANTAIKLIKPTTTTTIINEENGFSYSDTELTVKSVEGFSEKDYIRIGNEILQIEEIYEGGLTLKVARAKLDTTATDHANEETVTLVQPKLLSVIAVMGDHVTLDGSATDGDYFIRDGSKVTVIHDGNKEIVTSDGSKVTVPIYVISAIASPGDDDYADLDTTIANALLKQNPYSEKGIPQDALTEIVYIIRTGVIKDDFILESVSEWPLIEYKDGNTTIKDEYLEGGVLRDEYAFQPPTDKLKPVQVPYKPVNGLSSCYYYQQELGTDNKPMKNKACVMLAMGLEDKKSNKYIGILNFSVAASGHLSRLTTDAVNMPDINVQALDENPYDTFEQIPTNDANGVAWQQPQKMRLLDIDPNGLSTSGGVLKFAYTSADIGISAGYSDAVEATAPSLFDDSLGRVNLYFKGKHNNFFVLYFNPTGSKSIEVTDSSSQIANPLLSLKPRLDRDMTINVIATAPENSNTCTLTMTSQDSVVEQWRHLPKRLSQVAGILNGNSHLPLGTLEPLGNNGDPRAAYLKPDSGNGTFKLRTTVENHLLFQGANAYGDELANGTKHSLALSNLSDYLVHNTALKIANKQFSLDKNANATIQADVFYKSYLFGMVTDPDDINTLWKDLQTQGLIQGADTDKTYLTSKAFNDTQTSLRETIEKAIEGASSLTLGNNSTLKLLQEGNEADKKARLARLKQSLIALILDVAKVRILTFTVQDTNAQSVDRLEAGLTVRVGYDYKTLFTCTPANLSGTSAPQWEHFRSYLFNAGLDATTSPTTEIHAGFEYTYSINNTIGQWEDWEASLALEFTPESATSGTFLNTEDSDKLAALQPTEKGLSVEAWVKPSKDSSGSIIYYKKDNQQYSMSIKKDEDEDSKYKCVATLGTKKYISDSSFDFPNSAKHEQWKHLAFTHKQYWGYQLSKDNTINCGNDSSLHLEDEFTLELLVKIDKENLKGTLLEKIGEYKLSIDSHKKIVFSCPADKKNIDYLHDWKSGGPSSNTINGTPYRRLNKPDKLRLSEGFCKITLIRSKNKLNKDSLKTENPLTERGINLVCKLNKSYNGDEVSEVEVTGIQDGVIFKKGTKFTVNTSAKTETGENREPINIVLKSEIEGDGNVKIMKVETVKLFGNKDDEIHNFDKTKWYENKKSEDIIKGLAEKQSQMESQMNLSQMNMFGDTTASSTNSKYYHTVIIIQKDDDGNISEEKKEWTTNIAMEVKRSESFRDFILGGDKREREDDKFIGTFDSVRIWNRALSRREAEELSVPENKAGLLSHWRMAEGKGKYLYDNVSENHGVADGGEWVGSPHTNQPGQFQFYVDGSPEGCGKPEDIIETGIDQFSIGGIQKDNGSFNHFQGALEEIRIWNVPRTHEQITDNAFGRLKGEWELLLAHYTFDRPQKQTGYKVQDSSVNSVQLTVKNSGMLKEVLSTAPVATEIPQVRSALTGVLTEYNGKIYSRPTVVEYGDVQKNDDGTLNGILKRCYSFIALEKDKGGNARYKWIRMTGYKVGNLVSQWYGQAQFAPQVMGYLEGPPPVPAENFPVAKDADVDTYAYKLDNSVSFKQAEEVSYNYSTSKEEGWNVGVESEGFIGGAVNTIVAPFGVGISVKGKKGVTAESSWETSGKRSKSYETGVSINADQSFSASLAGYDNGKSGRARFYKLGNPGYALVKSKTADIYLLKLAHNNALVSISWQPNPDIPEDVNIIPFPINPLYTKQGTLDGKFGEKNDHHYPQAQSAYSQYSYFKPREAYQLKKQIEREKMQLKSYFEDSFDEGQASEYFKWAAQISAYAQAAAFIPFYGPFLTSIGNQVGGQLATQFNDVELRHDLANVKSQRNLVNTYSWTVEGGFYAESTEVAETQQETYVGEDSLSLGGKMGVGFELEGVASFEQKTLFASGSSFTLTKSKTKESSTSFGLDVSVDLPTSPRYKYAGVDGRTLTKGLISPGTVDAYRFMSFYLEPKGKNFIDLFSTVIDPIWLDESPDPNAQALRQARGNIDKAKPCWRIMHRVTYVSRILPEFQPEAPPSLEKSMRVSGIESNYMLIKKFEPYVAHITDAGDFFTKIEDIIDAQLPEFIAYKQQIKYYLALYFNIDQV